MSQKTTLQVKGLQTEPNQLSSVPEGSLLVGENVVITRENIIEPRRGFNKYGNSFGSLSDRAKQFLTYKNRILIHYATTLAFNANQHNMSVDGDFQNFSGTFAELDPGLRLRSVESNKNLYFTTNDGIKKISARTAADFTTSPNFIVDAGAPKALDVIGALISTTEGFLPPNSKVAYRVVWSHKDINNNLIAGTPSASLVINNTTGSNANVQLKFVIPQNVTAYDFYQVYRSATVTAVGNLTLDDISAGDELQLVFEDFPTAVQLTAGIVTLIDVAPEDFRAGGLFLYTNPNSGEGIGQANEPPPKAHDIAMYQSTVFYANIETRAKTTISLLGVEAFISGTSSITISDGFTPQTYTFVGAKEITNFNFSAYGAVPGALNGTYFLLNSSSDNRKYYTWYDTTKTQQLIDFSSITGLTYPADLDGKFFVLYTKDSEPEQTYYIYFDSAPVIPVIDPGTNPDNGLTGFNGIKVLTSGLTTTAQIANAVQAAIIANDNAIDADFDVNYATTSAVGSTVTLGTPTSFAAVAHGLETGDRVTVSNSTTTPSINGIHYITKTGANSFTIPVTTTVGGTADWTANSSLVIVYSESFDDTTRKINENIQHGFSFTFNTPTNADPAPVGLIPIRVNISRGVTTVAQLADATAAAIINQDTALDFVVSYTAAASNFTITNTNNGNTTDANNSTVGAGLVINVTQQGDGENAALNEVLLSAAASPAQQIDETARSLVNIINRNSLDTVYAFYVSGESDLPGKILFEVKDIGVNDFSIIANSIATGASFNPSLPPVVGAALVVGEAETKPNRIYYAKLQQPEAVPLLNFIDVGPEDKAISRILALRESLFILKEDGVYRLTGLGGNYAVDLFDESVKLLAPDTAVVLNNQIYCLSNQGMVSISDTGVSIISMPIASDVQHLSSANYNYKLTSFGVSYETDRSYLLWMPGNVNDTVATFAYRYHTQTNTFTTFKMAKTCGLVNPGDDKLYLGTNDTTYIERERKLFKRTDHADRDFELIVPNSAVNGKTLKLSSSVDIDIGDAVVQTQYVTVNEYNQLLAKLDLDPAIGQAEITLFDFSSYVGSIPSALHSKYFILYSASDTTRYVVFYDALGTLPSLDPNVYLDIADATQIRVDISSGVTTKAQVAEATKTAIQSATFDFIVTYLSGNEFFQTKTIRNGNTTDASDSAVNGILNGFAITVTTQGLGDYLSTLEMVAGDNIIAKLIALATKLDSDPGVDQTDYLAAIATYSAMGTSITTGSPTIINSVGHNLQTGRLVTINGSTTTPSINGDHIITRIDGNSFSIPFDTTGGGSGGDVVLASSAQFAVLASAAITGSTGTGSTINGDMGIYPNTLSSVTNFPPSTTSGTIHAANATANQAMIDATAAFTAMNLLNGSATAIPADLDGQILAPGVYKEASSTFALARTGNGTLTFNGPGTYIFLASSTLNTGAGGIPTMSFSGGATPTNTFIYWAVGSSATINIGVSSAGSIFYGTVIAQASVTATQAGIINGRIFALVGAATLSDTNTINVPISVTANWEANLTRFVEAQAAFNTIIIKLNDDVGVTYQNYTESEGSKEYEVLIIDKARNTTDVTMQFSMKLMEGPITVFKGINCTIVYSPEIFGDVSMLKQVSESTVIFEDANFSRATVGYKTDLSPGFETIDFTKYGKGDYSFFIWSQHNWGGGFSGVPLRTYVPRQKQRCRYIQLQFIHNSAREHFALYGFSYTFRPISERGYR